MLSILHRPPACAYGLPTIGDQSSNLRWYQRRWRADVRFVGSDFFAADSPGLTTACRSLNLTCFSFRYHRLSWLRVFLLSIIIGTHSYYSCRDWSRCRLACQFGCWNERIKLLWQAIWSQNARKEKSCSCQPAFIIANLRLNRGSNSINWRGSAIEEERKRQW